ncbi:MAG: AMP-binding protein [Gammaproteobacteria bacterium]|nr:AMP-binding protein [Gammaproteobacteria bacterium]
MNNYTSHLDTFVRDNLPPPEQMPDFLFTTGELQYPERLNSAAEVLDKRIAQGYGAKNALLTPNETWSYRDLYEKSNRIAHVLVEDLGLVPGNRVLLRSPNNPMLVACWFGVIKAGGVAVATMPLLRKRDLEPIINKAQVQFALCDERLMDELSGALETTGSVQRAVQFNGSGEAGAGAELERLMAAKEPSFDPVPTASDDPAIIAFTSGTTGQPKGTVHFQRDIMTMCICCNEYVVKPEPSDIIIGSPPVAFTFGLGMLVGMPLYAGASVALLEAAPPLELARAIGRFRATICSSAPTAYRAMLNHIDEFDLSSLKKSTCAGEKLPLPTYEEWLAATGLRMIDIFGSTEMIHVFISAVGDEIRPGASGKAITGYRACILDDDNRPAAPGTPGRLALKGPTGCKYLADERQKNYVVNGWNLTGDVCTMDEDGYVWYQGRTDDMIISSGYNISGAEVEAALLPHPAVSECGVVGIPDEARGMIIKAFVVPAEGVRASGQLAGELQEFAKRTIAPYKYPRMIEFISELPKTQTGKIQRHKLRAMPH